MVLHEFPMSKYGQYLEMKGEEMQLKREDVQLKEKGVGLDERQFGLKQKQDEHELRMSRETGQSWRTNLQRGGALMPIQMMASPSGHC